MRSKTSVSLLANKAESDKFAFSQRPSFMSSDNMRATDRGTAMHRVMQHFDFSKCNDIDTEIERLYEWQFISENENIANINDNDFNSYWLSARNQQEGDWFCLDFGRPMPVKTVKMLLADRVRPKHYPVRGQMEYSTDGQTWTPIGEENKRVSLLLDLSLSQTVLLNLL